MSGERVSGARREKQAPFDITEWPIPRQVLPGWLSAWLEVVPGLLPARSEEGRRGVLDEVEMMGLLAEALWAAERVGCVKRSCRQLAEDMTRRLRTRGRVERVTGRQVERWLKTEPVRGSSRRQEAVRLVRRMLVQHKRRTIRRGRRGMMLGPSKLLLHGGGKDAWREFGKD